MKKIYMLTAVVAAFFSYSAATAQNGCSALDITATTPASVCGGGVVTLSATASGAGDDVYWYDAAAAGSVVNTGGTFSPSVSATTSYYVAEVLYDSAGTLPGYCVPVAASSGCVYGDDINDFTLKDFTGATVISHLASGCSPNDYGDFTGDANLATVLIPGKTYDFSVSHSLSSQAGHYVGIWYDADRNGSFDDAGEMLFISAIGSSKNTPTTGSFTAPATSPLGLGPAVMRVVVSHGSPPASPCQVGGAYGEVHDYKIYGILCESPREEVVATVNSAPDKTIGGIPYTDSDDTANFASNYSGEPGGSLCGSGDYLDGRDVVYHYESTIDGTLNIAMSGLSKEDSAVYVYESCADIGSNCIAGKTAPEGSLANYDFFLKVENGKDYYIVVSSLGAGSSVGYTMDITTLDCNLNVVSSTAGSVCGEGSVTLSASGSGVGDAIFWYDAATEGELLGATSVFKSPEIASTTSYWATEVQLAGGGFVTGQGFPTYNYGYGSLSTNRGVMFTANAGFTLVSVDVFAYEYTYYNNDETEFTIELEDGSGSVIASKDVVVSAVGTTSSPTKTTIPLFFNIPGPGDYFLVASGLSYSDDGYLMYEYDYNSGNGISDYPIPLANGLGEMTAGYESSASGRNYYYYFYNWSIVGEALCESPRVEVVATVNDVADEEIASLDYSHTAETRDYENNYSGAPGDVCGTSQKYLAGNEVVYHYKATSDISVNVKMSGLTGGSSGVFIYKSCDDIGTACVTGAVKPQGATDYSFDFTMKNGEDYYIVVSGSDEEQNVGYTLDITEKNINCGDYAITATTDGSAICAGQIVLTATGSGTGGGAEIYWYDAETDGNLVHIGSSYRTPKLDTTTSYWVAEGIAEGPGDDIDATVICESSPRVEVTANVSATPHVAIGPVGGSVSYTTSDDTANYTDMYEGEPGCVDDNYFNGNDVVYQFTANSDGIVDIVLSDLTDFYAGIFVYEDCPSFGDNCLASAMAGPSDDEFRVDNLTVENGKSYFVVLSSWLSPTYGYTLEIIPCEVGVPIAEANQLFVQGETIADLEINKTSQDVTLEWYSDAAGTTPIPETTVLQNATTYYVRQIYDATCQGPLFAITVGKIECDALAITSSQDGQTSCKGTITLNAQASGAGSDIYWYDAPTGGNIVGLGETFETPVLTSTTDYYASEVQSLDGGVSLGQGLATPSGTYDTYTYDYYKFRGLAFTADKSFMILDVEVFSAGASGPMDVGLYDDNGNLMTSKSFTLPSGGTYSSPLAVTLQLNFVVPAAGDYYLGVSAQVPCCNFYMLAEYQSPSLGIWPIPLGSSGRITSSAYATSASEYTYDQYYFFLYNWSILEGDVACESLPRTKVTATVNQTGNVLVDALSDLPYNSTDNSGQYPNNFSGDPGADCRGSEYLNGNDVIYQFVADPSKDDIIDIELTGLNNPNTGLYIYDDCGLIGTTCMTGGINDGGDSIKIDDLYVTAGDDIFIVVSTQTGAVSYTIDITRVECNNVQEPYIDDVTPYFASGDMLSDLSVEGNTYNEGFKWYTALDGNGDPDPSSEIDPTTTNVQDGTTYYVTQTILGCEGAPLEIIPEAFPCEDMKILSASDDIILCAPGGDVEFTAEGSGIGDDVYWYDAPEDGNLVYVGEKFPYTASQTASFYAKEVFSGVQEPVTGQAMLIPGGSNDDYTYNYYPYKGLIFNVEKPFTLVDVEVFSTGTGGDLQVLLLDESRNTVNSASFTIPSGSLTSPVPVTLKLGFFVPPGEYLLGAYTNAACCDFSMLFETTGSFPYPLGSSGEITYGEYSSGTYVYDENDYNFFYNWTILEPDPSCASAPTEFKVTVNGNTYPTTANSNQKFCEGATVEDLMSNSTVETIWYESRTPGTGSLSPDTILEDGETYYVSQVVDACESPRRYPVTVKIVPIADLPIADRNQVFSQGSTIDSLEVQGTNLTWFYDKDNDGDLDEIEDPSSIVLEDQETYYVSQYPNGFCESEKQPITVHLDGLGTEDPVFEGLSYYPNPVQHVLNISSATSQIESVHLFDLQGRKVVDKKVDAQQTTLGTSNLQSGVYVLRVIIEGKTGVFKIVKE